MQSRHDTLRDELVAVLGAGRELPVDVDRQLADAFLHYLEHEEELERTSVDVVEAPHQPHYSLKVVGGTWGAALMFLFLLLLLDNPNPVAYLLLSAVLLTLVAAVTRALLYLARYGWQLPRVKVVPAGKPHSRG